MRDMQYYLYYDAQDDSDKNLQNLATLLRSFSGITNINV